jgi:hypothetical protein
MGIVRITTTASVIMGVGSRLAFSLVAAMTCLIKHFFSLVF